MTYDVAIVGGGPAGLATSLALSEQGLSCVVLERAPGVPDKACGEGLMPAGLALLERWGVRGLLSSADASPFVGIRYVQEDGTQAEGRLPGTGGLAVRRVALTAAMARRAAALGVEVRQRARVERFCRVEGGVRVELDGETVRARVLVAADGLGSPLRHAEGLDAPVRGARRFGLRQHFRRAAWSPFVEVHLSVGAEAYVTPAGEGRVGVAFLFEDGTADPVRFGALLERFPLLAERLAGAEPDSQPRGAGPFLRAARLRVADRFALVGDAAGYVDAVTGEGLSLAFACADSLGRVLPAALVHGATRETLWPYERAWRRHFRDYAWTARALLALARRPRLRRQAVHALARRPALFEWALARVAGA